MPAGLRPPTQKTTRLTPPHEDYYHGIELMGSQDCAAPNNRCPPINYIKYEGKPFAAENVSELPVRVPLKMDVIRSNQQEDE